MFSTGMTWEITPLFPWRPAILSPTWIFLNTATETWIERITPDGKFVALFAGEFADVDDFAVFAVRQSQRSVFYVAGFFAEDDTEQVFLQQSGRFHLLA
jgi:hypothetical protein